MINERTALFVYVFVLPVFISDSIPIQGLPDKWAV
jgi:hypothetical protein